MKFAIFSRQDSTKIDYLRSILTSLGIDYELNPSCDDFASFDIGVTLGGDGTFLDAVRQMGAADTKSGSEGCYMPLIGINGGRLGFLATVSLEKCKEAFEAVLNGDYSYDCRSMLKIEGISGDVNRYALNEFTIQKRDVSMVEIQIKIDEVEVATFWADGVIVSTPTGSTAYSMSVGGSILAPQSSCFVISPIAPHNLSLRPFVIQDSAQVELIVRSRYDRGAIVTMDNSRCEVEDGTRIVLNKSENRLQIIKVGDSNFYRTLRNKLHWGVDLRRS